jgi:lipoprotein signal peptidase
VGERESRGMRTLRWFMGLRRTRPRAAEAPGRRATDREPMRGWIPAACIAAFIAVADWTIKARVNASIALEDFRVLIDDRIALWHVRNDAMMLGLWGDFPLEVRMGIATAGAVIGSLALLQVLGYSHRLPPHARRWAWLFVGLVLGGMAGNLGERLLHWGVTDYFSIRWGEHWLPPGNLADLALFLSIPVALPVMVAELRARARRGASGARGIAARAAETAGAD